MVGGRHTPHPPLMSNSEALSLLYLNKSFSQKLWAIKPYHWPWIESLSSGGQESWNLSWLSCNLSKVNFLNTQTNKKKVFIGWQSLPKSRETIKVKDLLIWWHNKFNFFFFFIPGISRSKTICGFKKGKKKKKTFIFDSVKDKLQKISKSPLIVFLYFSEHFHLCLYLSWTRPCAICRIYYPVGKRLMEYDHVLNTLNILPDIKTFFYLKHHSFYWFMSLSWWYDLYRMIFNAEGSL